MSPEFLGSLSTISVELRQRPSPDRFNSYSSECRRIRHSTLLTIIKKVIHCSLFIPVTMSAAAVRRRKQLAARGDSDVVGSQLKKLLDVQGAMTEETAYEALQLAQSVVRKRVNAKDYQGAADLCFTASLTILEKGRVSVASQLLTITVEVLTETQTPDSPHWTDRIAKLQAAHCNAMAKDANGQGPEAARLNRLQRDWLRAAVQWSADLGTVKYGNPEIHALLAQQCWTLSKMGQADANANSNAASTDPKANANADYFDEEDIEDFQCDAVIYMALAEKPDQIVAWLETLPEPTEQERQTGHTCPPALRDALLTRAVLCMVAMENLRDANTLVRAFLDHIVKQDSKALAISYTNKEDGKAPSHAIFCCMLLRTCEKDGRTGPLFSWLLRSFKRELEMLFKPAVVLSYTTKIGKVYFNIQPPPSMLKTMEGMMSMMGGGGGGGGGIGGMNPAMMQAAMAQMQGGGMM